MWLNTLQFILDYSPIIILGTVISYWLLQAINEYYPTKPRFNDSFQQEYMNYLLYKRYIHGKSIKDIPTIKVD
jgi:hypothetical protein